MGTTERRERERAQRRADILTTARNLFFTKGFRETTMDEIARSIELARGTVYLYFATKEEIYATVLEEGIDLLHSLVTKSYSNTASPLHNLLETLDALLRFHELHPQYSNVLMLHQLEIHEQLSPELQKRLDAKGGWFYEWIYDLLRQGVTQKAFRPMPIEETATLLLALNRGLLIMQDFKKSMVETDGFKKALHDFVAAAVLAPQEIKKD